MRAFCLARPAGSELLPLRPGRGNPGTRRLDEPDRPRPKQAHENGRKWMKTKLANFAFFCFSKTGLFNGLQPIQMLFFSRFWLGAGFRQDG
jgi:hypothetical protein